jgi:hypothetical protein
MENQEDTIDRRYWQIGEVADWLNVRTSEIRFWMDALKITVKTTARGNRLFNEKDFRTMMAVRYLINVEMYTIKGAFVKLNLWYKGKYKIPEKYLTTPAIKKHNDGETEIGS